MRRGTIPTLILASLLLLACSACFGQARYAGTGPGSLVTVGVEASGYQIDYSHRYLGGGAVYADFNVTWRLGIEGEARFLRYHQSADTHETTWLIGPRWSFGKSRFNPYVKGLVGLGQFNFPYDYAHGSYFVVAPGAGLDWRLNRRIRWRVADFEYQEWPQFTYGAIHPYGLSTGISFSLLHSGTRRGNE